MCRSPSVRGPLPRTERWLLRRSTRSREDGDRGIRCGVPAVSNMVEWPKEQWPASLAAFSSSPPATADAAAAAAPFDLVAPRPPMAQLQLQLAVDLLDSLAPLSRAEAECRVDPVTRVILKVPPPAPAPPHPAVSCADHPRFRPPRSLADLQTPYASPGLCDSCHVRWSRARPILHLSCGAAGWHTGFC